MKLVKRLLVAVMAVAMVASLAACDSLSGKSDKDLAKSYIQGWLDLTYLGKFNEDYLEFTETTEEEAKAQYEDGLGVEADYFAYFVSINEEACPEELRQDVMDMYRQIYAKSKYTVGEPTKAESGNYLVEVTYEPIDIMTQFTVDEMMDQFYMTLEEHGYSMEDEEGLGNITDEEYDQIMLEYGRKMIDMVTGLIPTLDYGPEATYAFTVKVEDNVFEMVEDDILNFDSKLIIYE